MNEGEILYDLRTIGPTIEGHFVQRLNRFVAIVEVEGKSRRAHIADTGRLEEILISNRPLLLLTNRPGMKTDFTLLATKMEEGWVLINTRLHRPIARSAIEKGVLGFLPHYIQEEKRFGDSRFDYLVDNGYVELKGCSLVADEHCLFPNAPTTRGVKHLLGLMKAKTLGFNAFLLIMALRPCRCFMPHPNRDETFRKTFYKALEKGVVFRGFRIRIKQRFIIFDGMLDLCQH